MEPEVEQDGTIAKMDAFLLLPGPFEGGPKKELQVRDAQDMYQTVVRKVERSNTPIPPYDFLELIGKGAFGRVYKCKNRETGALVALKIISIDDADFAEHVLDKDNSIAAFRREVGILQQLKDRGARNVNMIHDAFDLHDMLIIVSDYCTGGSVRTLMRANPPTRRGLEEAFLIPIARELATAIQSVHDIGVIHRDIKCANVYINEEGDIQLGDFGIVGVLDDGTSRRRTIIGTPHYLPRELLVDGLTVADGYGFEVDIWSFGVTVFEMATGLPPNTHVMDPQDLHHSLAKAPRLEDGDYSDALRDFVAFCLNSDPQERPKIDAVLKHPYIANSARKYPSRSLIQLIERYAIWEHRGGQRQSLWHVGGAAAPMIPTEIDTDAYVGLSEWNFSTSDDFNVAFGRRYSQMPDTQGVASPDFEAPAGSGLPPIITKDLTPVELMHQRFEEMSASRGERSLDRLWNTDKEEYKLHTPIDDDDGSFTSDLPLRAQNSGAMPRESVIDMGEMNLPTFNFDFGDGATLRAKTTRLAVLKDEEEESDYQYTTGESDERRATMDWTFPGKAVAPPAQAIEAGNRATMDWSFSTAEPAQPDDANASMSLPPAGFDGATAPGFRPILKHTQTEPIGNFTDYMHSAPSQMQPLSGSPVRNSMASMIDLDMGSLSDPADIIRPSTAHSTAGSMMSDMTSGNPFDLEEDPEQNERDSKRFSHHKQWQSEGSQLVRRSGTHKTMPMHTRGSSLTSDGSSADLSSSDGGEDVFDYNRRAGDMRTQMLNRLPQDNADSMLSSWPSFGSDSGVDDRSEYGSSFGHFANQGQMKQSSSSTDFSSALQHGLRTASSGSMRSFSRPRTRNGSGGSVPRELEHPIPQPAHPDALLEEADLRLVGADLDRLLADISDGFAATIKALALHAEVDSEREDGDSAWESSRLQTGDEDSL